MARTFIGGVHPKEEKSRAGEKPIRDSRLPSKVIIPMIQHTGAPCEIIVKPGDSVKKGQLIGRATKFISSPVHASISGIVKELRDAPHPTAGRSAAVVIESDGKDEWHESVSARPGAARLKAAELADIIRDSGIVGLGGGAFPSHVKIKEPKKIDAVILNGAECEPYLACDERLMTERAGDILKGLRLIMNAVEAEEAFIAIEANKPAAVLAVRKALEESDSEGRGITLKVLPVKYPQGSERQLIEVILGRRVPPRGLPIDVNCVVYNVGTASAICEAVYKGRPLVERTITLSGDCIREPVNMKVRIGTVIGELLEECGGPVRPVSKVIVGGPMMGAAQPGTDAPVTKGTTGVLFLSEKKARVFDEISCIKCGRCVDACPMNLLPLVYAKFVKKEKWDRLSRYNIDDCIECGSCAYVCPSRIPLVQYIKTGKRELFYIRKTY